MNVLMIYPKFPEQTFWNSVDSVRALWGRKGIMPPLGLLTLASYLPEDFSLRLIDRNVSEETESQWSWADVVFVSAMMAQRQDYEACVAEIKRRGKPLAVGGPLTHALPEVACADADWVCFGEAETIIDQLVSDLRADRRGKQYHGGSATAMELAKVPRFELLPEINDYATMALQFSRGCPFKCEFCDIIEIYGRVPRTKTPAQVCDELALLERLGFEGYVFLVDDNFIGNKRKAKDLLHELAAWNGRRNYPFRYYTEASINVADDEELLDALSRAGFFHLFVGIETPDPKLLETAQKRQNLSGNLLHKLDTIRRHGIHVTAGFILGFDGEGPGVFAAQSGFIQASGIGVAMLGLLQAIPHTQLSRRLKEQGRLLETLSSTGNLTLEGINFIPNGTISRREYFESYSRLVHEVYQPKSYFLRILPALLSLRARIRARTVVRHGATLLAVLLREMYHFGLKTKATRLHFWKTLLTLLWKNPAALEAFVFDTAVYFHLRLHVEFVRNEVAAYLAASPNGVALDRAIISSASGPEGDSRRARTSAA